MGFVAHTLLSFAPAELSLGVAFGPVQTTVFAGGIPLLGVSGFNRVLNHMDNLHPASTQVNGHHGDLFLVIYFYLCLIFPGFRLCMIFSEMVNVYI